MKTAIVSQEFASKFATEKETPYTRWVREEGLEIISSFYVQNLHTVELKPWPRRGSTAVWNDAGKRIQFEWKAGAIFAIPLNCWHQHFNGSGREPARYVAVTNAPVIINAFGDTGFVFNKRYDWKEGAMIVPPNLWFHQHFNTGTTPARYLAFKAEGVAIRNAQGVPKAWISRRLGGDQIDYADERPEIRRWFAEALAKHGLQSNMDKAYSAEAAELPQKAA